MMKVWLIGFLLISLTGCSVETQVVFEGNDIYDTAKEFIKTVRCPDGFAMTHRKTYSIKCTRVVE